MIRHQTRMLTTYAYFMPHSSSLLVAYRRPNLGCGLLSSTTAAAHFNSQVDVILVCRMVIWINFAIVINHASQSLFIASSSTKARRAVVEAAHRKALSSLVTPSILISETFSILNGNQTPVPRVSKLMKKVEQHHEMGTGRASTTKNTTNGW